MLDVGRGVSLFDRVFFRLLSGRIVGALFSFFRLMAWV